MISSWRSKELNLKYHFLFRIKPFLAFFLWKTWKLEIFWAYCPVPAPLGTSPTPNRPLPKVCFFSYWNVLVRVCHSSMGRGIRDSHLGPKTKIFSCLQVWMWNPPPKEPLPNNRTPSQTILRSRRAVIWMWGILFSQNPGALLIMCFMD